MVAFGRRLELDGQELALVRQQALGGTAPVNLLRPRARRLLLDALWRKSGRRFDDAELAAEERQGFDEDIAGEQDFLDFLDAWWPVLEPRRVLAALADEKRLARWARRVLSPPEVRRVARSLRRDGLLPCTTWRCWTSWRRCSARRRATSAASWTRWTSSPVWRS